MGQETTREEAIKQHLIETMEKDRIEKEKQTDLDAETEGDIETSSFGVDFCAFDGTTENIDMDEEATMITPV